MVTSVMNIRRGVTWLQHPCHTQLGVELVGTRWSGPESSGHSRRRRTRIACSQPAPEPSPTISTAAFLAFWGERCSVFYEERYCDTIQSPVTNILHHRGTAMKTRYALVS